MSDEHFGPLGNGPYGPCTPRVRDFLVRLAGLGNTARADVISRYAACSEQSAYHAADTLLGDTIARSGREDVRDALAGPLLQLVQRADLPDHPDAHEDPLQSLDAIAEPALAAALALLVSDLIPADTVRVLYAPFHHVMPLGTASH